MIFLKTFGIALFISLLGFIKFIYFISLSYGFSVASIGFFLFFKIKTFTPIQLLFCLLYIIYGLRLSLFLLIREFNEHYNKKIFQTFKKTNEAPIIKKIIVWICCALLYACQTSPLTFRIISDNDDDILSYIGIIITTFGLILEIKADNEKSAAKKINPKKFVDTGLYRIVRCPNYFGEIIFWTGNFITGFQIYYGLFQWFISIFGYVLIIYIMFSGARRLELRQNESYGKDPDYQEYVKKIPILIPFLPLYSVEKYTWLKG